MLMAERDRRSYQREQESLEREKELMKDVPGWEVRRFPPSYIDRQLIIGYRQVGKSVYHNTRYRPIDDIVVL